MSDKANVAGGILFGRDLTADERMVAEAGKLVVMKVGAVLPVSSETLAEMREARAAEDAWRALTPAEREARSAERARVRRADAEADRALHGRIMAELRSRWVPAYTAALIAIGERHAPNEYGTCTGDHDPEMGARWRTECAEIEDVAAAVGLSVGEVEG